MIVEITMSQEILDKLGITIEDVENKNIDTMSVFSSWLRTEEGQRYARQHKRRLDDKNS